MNLQSNNFIIELAALSVDRFTKTQKQFWEQLSNKFDLSKPIPRNEFSPSDFVPFLPSIFLGDLIVDADGKLIDVINRLSGTKLASVYGNRKNQSLMAGRSEEDMSNQLKAVHERFGILVNKMFTEKTSIYTYTDFVDENKIYINATSFMIPMTNNGTDLNMALGYVEVSYK
ncbi:MAG: hypothetical protein P8H03_05335 [Emcibacteraceae bacterium]|nr:hypothetical protein [Emcibacteraceae bacterium]MDG1859826.1 hypothetical protein [Emcibacteraceae bacterium]